jgi:hypothetical protein
MTKPSKDNISQIVDEILSEMPLEEKVSLAKMKKEDLRFSQVFLICIFDVRLILKMRNMKILCTSYGKEFKRLTD